MPILVFILILHQTTFCISLTHSPTNSCISNKEIPNFPDTTLGLGQPQFILIYLKPKSSANFDASDKTLGLLPPICRAILDIFFSPL